MTPEEAINGIHALVLLLGLKPHKINKWDIYVDDPISHDTYLNVWVSKDGEDIHIDPNWDAYTELVDDPIKYTDSLSVEEKFKVVERVLVDIRNKLNEHNT